MRIDKYLATVNCEELYSRSLIEKIINRNEVKVNGMVVKKNYLLVLNDLIEIEFQEDKLKEAEPENIPLNIVYEDEDLAVINKPEGLVVHPGHGNLTGTLVNGLVNHFGDNLSNERGVARQGIVHRIDKGTSGLLIIAKNNLVHARLEEMFRNREIKKIYKAILVGYPETDSGTIQTFLRRSKSNPLKIVVSNTGRDSITHYEVEKYFKYFSLVNADLETGRTHQIRVHFANQNNPVLGDRLYSSVNDVATRIPSNYKKRLINLYDNVLINQALHAYKIEFMHPITKKLITVKSDLPDYFRKALAWLETNFSIDD
ncbi:MAG: RluA family pseudouridine synthase [Candidatus Cloacimonadales bacterium]